MELGVLISIEIRSLVSIEVGDLAGTGDGFDVD
jgi:hypothetical protein